MRIQVTCESYGDADELRDWLENQDILTVEYHSNEGNTRDEVIVTIEPHLAPETPLQAASMVNAWSRLMLEMFAQELCY